MTFSPLPHPWNAGLPATTLEAVYPALATPSVSAHRLPKLAEHTAQASGHQKQEKRQGERTELSDTTLPLTLIPFTLITEVERRSLDPFDRGVLVGAVAATIGFVFGLCVYLVN